MNPMHIKQYKPLLLLLLLLIFGCQFAEKNERNQHLKADYLIRKQEEHFFIPPAPLPRIRESYPWEETAVGGFPRITKEFFRCKGSIMHPVVTQERDGKPSFYYRDCSGSHSLPLHEKQEFIYPVLIDILNFIQGNTKKRVVVTSGHCCPSHNTYCDFTPYNWGSKHMIGAEVDFYVEGMEEDPTSIIHLLMSYYQEDPDYKDFSRFESDKLNISTPAWYNKEIFVKLYLPYEGRDVDNQHPHPYIGIQVRYDRKTQKKVIFTKECAQNYLRH